jgi:hypothetical protein
VAAPGDRLSRFVELFILGLVTPNVVALSVGYLLRLWSWVLRWRSK